MYIVVTPQTFLRRANKFFKKHPDLKSSFAGILDDLMTDPFSTHLNLHQLRGKFTGLYAVSLTYSYRITLSFQVTEKEIILLDIGSHDEVYR